MTCYVSNAFSLSMLDRGAQAENPREPRPVTVLAAQQWLATEDGVVSCVGHADTAALLSGLLEVDLAANRVSVRLGPDDSLLVGQYVGPRLPEGATKLPEGATVEWWVV